MTDWRQLIAEHLPPVPYREPDYPEEPEVPASQVRYPQLNNRDWLHERYVTHGIGISDIARELGCTPPAVRKALTRHELLGKQRKPDETAMPTDRPPRRRTVWAVPRPGGERS